MITLDLFEPDFNKKRVNEETQTGDPVIVQGCDWNMVVAWLVKNVGPITKKNPNYSDGYEGQGWILYPLTFSDKQGRPALQISAATNLPNKEALKAAIEKVCRQPAIDEDVKFPYPPRSEKLGRANFELLIRAYNEPTGPRLTLYFGDRVIDMDREDVDAIANYYDNELKTTDARWNFIRIVMSDADNLNDLLRKLDRRSGNQPGLFQETKKKDNEELGPQTKDVALQRAISRAKADFPTAGSGIEALAKDFMRSQEQDQKSFDQLRDAERKQQQILNQINKMDQRQDQEIDDLENANSSLSQRIQQLQAVNTELEKKLAGMSGRKAKPSAAITTMMPEPDNTSGAIAAIGTPATKDAEKATTQPAGPAAGRKFTPRQFKKVTRIPRVKPAVVTKVQQFPQLTTQNPDVLEPTMGRKPPSFSGQKDAIDVVARSPMASMAQSLSGRDQEVVAQPLRYLPPDRIKKSAANDTRVEPTVAVAETHKKSEADYGPDYQDMVRRVGKLAKQGPRKTVWDPVKRVYKTVPINPPKDQGVAEGDKNQMPQGGIDLNALRAAAKTAKPASELPTNKDVTESKNERKKQ
jgi:hypothetical protein